MNSLIISDDINNIITEIENLKNQGISLSKDLDTEVISSEFNRINMKEREGYYTLPKMYSFYKRIQKSINLSLYNNDIDPFVKLYGIVESIRKKLGKEYEIRSEIATKVRNIKQICNDRIASDSNTSDSS